METANDKNTISTVAESLSGVPLPARQLIIPPASPPVAALSLYPARYCSPQPDTIRLW